MNKHGVVPTAGDGDDDRRGRLHRASSSSASSLAASSPGAAVAAASPRSASSASPSSHPSPASEGGGDGAAAASVTRALQKLRADVRACAALARVPARAGLALVGADGDADFARAFARVEMPAALVLAAMEARREPCAFALASP